VAASLAPFVKDSSAVLLKNHGVVTYGSTLADAYFKMEKVEHAAQILLLARLLGGESVLSTEELARLVAVSPASYGKTVRLSAAAEPAPGVEPDRAYALPEEEILTAIRQMIQKGTL
jgi:rhamnose utilization protein RhaD (predicted bifunctional aldolase and dehydrogenase)